MTDNGVFQFVQTDILPRRRKDDRTSGEGFEFFAVNGDSFFLRLIDEIDAENPIVRDLADLKKENQAPFETAGVAHDNHRVGRTLGQKITGAFLLRRVTGEGIDARQVGQTEFVFSDGDGSFRDADGFARPVAGVLTHSGEGVEDGAFPDVRVSGEGGVDSHPRTSCPMPETETSTIPASHRRRAITAPRTR